MKPSSFKIFAISNFIFEIGISTFSALIRVAFRILVSISATGSVSIHYLHEGQDYQLAFITPGICPSSARVLKQILQIPNFRR
jgi:hypothetical protein